MDDVALLERLLGGDEAAFTALVTRYHPTLVRVARAFVRTDEQAEDVAQDTWMGVVRGIERFEGRSTFKTWLLNILVNRARTTGARELRSVPVDLTGEHPTVDAARFDRGGMWSDPPAPFTDLVEAAADDAGLIEAVRAAIDALPEPYRAVVALRDAEGLSTAEVSALLGLGEGNVRVILHRGRARVRAAAEQAWLAAGRRTPG